MGKRRCTKHHTYSDRADAIPLRERLIARQGTVRNLNIYWCPQHKGYHVGHRSIPVQRTRVGRC